MAKKKGKSVSFDAMVKFFLSSYQIPTKRDIDALNARLDRIERLLIANSANAGRRSGGKQDNGQAASASDLVVDIISRYQEGIGFAEIKLQTGYGEKKLRNILFRLNKIGKIKRKSRGIYQMA